MLDIRRWSPPRAIERLFTFPVAGAASFQKKLKVARWISSSNWSSVPSYGTPPGGRKVLLLEEQDGRGKNAVAAAAPRRITSRRVSMCISFTMLHQTLTNKQAA